MAQFNLAEVEHSGSHFLNHLTNTGKILEGWGCPHYLVAAGICHSLYGTQYFELSEGPDREKVKEILDERAERIVYLFCTMQRTSLYANRDLAPTVQKTVINRFDGVGIPISDEDFRDLVSLDVANFLEQRRRAGWKGLRWDAMARRNYTGMSPFLPEAAAREIEPYLQGVRHLWLRLKKQAPIMPAEGPVALNASKST
ncbi:DUF6817 domain-containing protein [Sulfidibacter corallicola]|uniref:DUF6817 domain-containing protein n=1 Tax=Sulfidibacter corallicola TaxID=2818388 RepID=A0A8A4TRS3_SULCO|nr:hypothetical protein [Sulfidibacter corallicola]QTD52250.1 hypothetical protein J3U87_07230 [Sulfidibacter corallicola]